MSIFSNNLQQIAQQKSVAAGGYGTGSGESEAKRTITSDCASGFKWNKDNRALSPAFDDKEYLVDPNSS